MAMKKPFRKLRFEAPDALTRAAMVSAAIAVVVPLACAALGRPPGTAWPLRNALSLVAFGTGVLCGLAALVLATPGLHRPGGPTLATVAAIFVGVLAVPMSFFSAMVASGPIR